MHEQPELAAAALARLAENEPLRRELSRTRRGEASRARPSPTSRPSSRSSTRASGRRKATVRGRDRTRRSPTGEWILADLHLHTSWSHDCAVGVEELLDHAEATGLGAIAVTDHNVFGGALEAVELARDRDLIVMPGEEVKTDGQGEVIGLFLSEEIPRGMSFADTIAAIRAQGGLVYLPHPFDRLHSIPDPATLHHHLADIDVFEVYNARLLFEAYNDEALRFARKYNLTMGAGSDAHVLQGLGTGGRPHARLRRARRSSSSASARPRFSAGRSRSRYLQSLKWVAQVKERSGRGELERCPP